MRTLFAICFVIMCSSVARAEDAAIAGAKARLAEQVKALNAGSGEAFAKTFASNGLAILPGANDEASADDIGKLVDRVWPKGATASIDKPQYGKGSMGGWYFANLVVKS